MPKRILRELVRQSWLPRPFGRLLALALFASAPLGAEPLSKAFNVDFYRDVPSRNLHGVATRSDGRLLAGPVTTDLSGPAIGELLWTLEPEDNGRWLVGTGPEGRIFEITVDATKASYSAKEVVKLDDRQVFALKRLPDGGVLAGTSPSGSLVLVREGKVVSRIGLPVDSLFDLSLRGEYAYAATGNPGRIYQIDLKKFAGAGVEIGKLSDATRLAAKGVTVFGEIRDRNVRRLAWLGDRLIAGSSPRGNIYAFPSTGGAPSVLQENRDAEVAALLPQPDGDLYAALVFTNIQGDNRINRPTPPKPVAAEPNPAEPPTVVLPPLPAEKFGGRGAVVYFPKSGFPETIVGRAGLAFYALAKHGDTLLIGGGEQGDLLGYDVKLRQSLSFAGSASAQLNQLLPLGPDQYLATRNNLPGLAVIDFSASGQRQAETRRFDLSVPATLGAFRLSHIAGADLNLLSAEIRANLSSDEVEGWTPWTPAPLREDGFFAPNLRGRFVQIRLHLPATGSFELGHATLFHLPQNHRPQLSEFHLISPNFALVPPPEPTTSVVTTLGQLIGTSEHPADEKRKSSLLSSTIVPQNGSQIALWTVTDPDGDNFACNFSIRREGTNDWIDVSVSNRDGYAQFDTSHLPEGSYNTRLVVNELAPRPPGERLSVSFETDELLVDHTAPVITETSANRDGRDLIVTVSGRDALSLLDSADFVFNNGYREEVSQPVDGIRDSRSESFSVRVPIEKVSSATAVEIQLYDDQGNTAVERIALPSH